MDVHSKETRTFNMSRIRSRDTKPEMIIRSWLWANGYRYRLHYNLLPGKPDLVFLKHKRVVFVHGCFWHQHDCKRFKWPRSNSMFWRDKINSNVLRDEKNLAKLLGMDWKAIVVWECEIKNGVPEELGAKIKSFLRPAG